MLIRDEYNKYIKYEKKLHKISSSLFRTRSPESKYGDESSKPQFIHTRSHPRPKLAVG